MYSSIPLSAKQSIHFSTQHLLFEIIWLKPNTLIQRLLRRISPEWLQQSLKAILTTRWCIQPHQWDYWGLTIRGFLSPLVIPFSWSSCHMSAIKREGALWAQGLWNQCTLLFQEWSGSRDSFTQKDKWTERHSFNFSVIFLFWWHQSRDSLMHLGAVEMHGFEYPKRFQSEPNPITKQLRVIRKWWMV